MISKIDFSDFVPGSQLNASIPHTDLDGVAEELRRRRAERKADELKRYGRTVIVRVIGQKETEGSNEGVTDE
jgi:hypothetical protein